jgi:hypothetical protein
MSSSISWLKRNRLLLRLKRGRRVVQLGEGHPKSGDLEGLRATISGGTARVGLQRSGEETGVELRWKQAAPEAAFKIA